MRRPSIKTEIKLDAYPIISRAVEEGIAYGVRRAFKHRDDSPSDDAIRSIENEVRRAVMDSLSEVIIWPSNGV